MTMPEVSHIIYHRIKDVDISFAEGIVRQKRKLRNCPFDYRFLFEKPKVDTTVMFHNTIQLVIESKL